MLDHEHKRTSAPEPQLAAPEGRPGRADAGARARAGRSTIDRMLADPACPSPAGTVTLCVDTDTMNRGVLSALELAGGQVGHAFLRYTPGPQALPARSEPTSIGFWPDTALDWDGIVRRAKWTASRVFTPNVHIAGWWPGIVKQPDTARTSPCASYSFSLAPEQVERLFAYVDSKRGASYSLVHFNCTTFAKEAVAATGHAPPELPDHAISMPNRTYRAILKHWRRGDPAAQIAPLRSRARGAEIVHEQDADE